MYISQENCVCNVLFLCRVVEMQEIFDQQQEDEAAELEGGSISSLVTDGNKRCDKGPEYFRS